jgi:hypothetical protein
MIGTHFSEDRLYRYTLDRSHLSTLLEPLRFEHRAVLFIGCNPSDADESEDDPTVTRERNFARSWGYGTYLKGNVFARVSTDPKPLRALSLEEQVGPDNLFWLEKMIAVADLVICAWGALGPSIDAGACDLVNAQIPEAKRRVLRLTKHGHPWHPLYLPKNLTPQPWPEVRR